MAWAVKQRLLVCQFDQAPEVHDTHLVAHMAHHGQVVRDEQIGQAALALQVFHDVQHLCLDADIQRRRGLVTNQKFWLGAQRTRDRNPLALATGELVRVLGHVQRIQAHRPKQFSYPCLARARIGNHSVLLQGLTHDVFHRPARVQAGIGVLENHLDMPAQVMPLW